MWLMAVVVKRRKARAPSEGGGVLAYHCEVEVWEEVGRVSSVECRVEFKNYNGVVERC